MSRTAPQKIPGLTTKVAITAALGVLAALWLIAAGGWDAHAWQTGALMFSTVLLSGVTLLSVFYPRAENWGSKTTRVLIGFATVLAVLVGFAAALLG
jgi:hypothetical protein